MYLNLVIIMVSEYLQVHKGIKIKCLKFNVGVGVPGYL